MHSHTDASKKDTHARTHARTLTWGGSKGDVKAVADMAGLEVAEALEGDCEMRVVSEKCPEGDYESGEREMRVEWNLESAGKNT